MQNKNAIGNETKYHSKNGLTQNVCECKQNDMDAPSVWGNGRCYARCRMAWADDGKMPR